MSKGGFQNPKYANQSGSTSGYGSQGNFGMGYPPSYGGAGTYDPMLGFGQASGMGTTYNAPTRYTADYTRFLQSGQQFNQPVMGYNSYGQIFAQPRRQPPPTMGGKGGFSGFQQPRPQMRRPAPTMGGKGGFGGFQDNFGQQQTFRQPYRQRQTPDVPPITTPATPTPTGTTVDTNIANSPFAGLIGFGLGGMPQQTVDPYQGSYNISTIPYQGGTADLTPVQQAQASGTAAQNAYNPAFQQQQQLLAQQQQISDPTPPGMMRNPNYNPARAMQDNVPMPGSDDYLNRQPFIPIGGGLGGMVAGRPQDPNLRVMGERNFDMLPNNPAYQQQLAFSNQQQISDRAPTGMMRNPNFDAASSMLDNVALPGSADALSRQAFIPANDMSGRAPFDNEVFQNFNFGQDFGRMAFQEGGQVPPDAASNMELMLSEAGPANPQSEMAGEYDRLIQMTMQAVLGQIENPDEIIQMFINEFGADAFRQLRDAVLKQQVPGAQTEGMVDGKGGGMDDQVMGMIGNQRPVAVSPGEYIVPADVVSGLGDGSSKSGADILDELNQAVRMARTGTTEQPRPLAESMR